LPQVDDELDEIRKLISDANPGPPSRPKPSAESKALIPARPKQAVPVRPKPTRVSTSRSASAVSPAPKRIINAPVQKPVTVREYDISSTGKVTMHRDNPEELDTGDMNFDVNFDFDGEYMDVPEERPLRLRREKRTGCIGGILYAAFIICIGLLLGSVLWMAAVDVLGFSSVDEAVTVVIPPDFDMDYVSERLYEAGVIRYRFLFNLYADFSNAEDKITSGSFILNRNFDYRAIVQGMTARAGVRVETTVTIPEGFTLLQIFTLLADAGVVHTADELWETATNHDFQFHFLDSDTLGERFRLEGFLFPETYNFFKASNPVTVINRMLNEFNRRFGEDYVTRAEEMGMSIRDIVNVAAMVEREAANDVERPAIASVIYNRLDNPAGIGRGEPFLEIDATLSYAVQGTDLVASPSLDHPFNTYMHPGLPPWPIANPGIASIRAALFPEETNFFFYALHVDGTHRFFRTYDEHRTFVRSPDFGRWW